jgi:cytochrome P450
LLDPCTIDREGLQMLIKALFRLDDSFRQLAQAHREGYDSLFYRSLLKGYGGEGICYERFSTDHVTMLIGGSETSEALTGNVLCMLALHP